MGSERHELAQQQRAVVEALVGRAHLPAGMADAKAAHAATVLAAKRLREIRLAMPATAAALGPSFPILSAAYAQKHGYPARGGPLADAAGLTRFLQRQKQLPAEGIREAVLLRARFDWPIQCHRIGGAFFVTLRLANQVRLWTFNHRRTPH